MIDWYFNKGTDRYQPRIKQNAKKIVDNVERRAAERRAAERRRRQKEKNRVDWFFGRCEAIAAELHRRGKNILPPKGQ